MDKIVNGWCLSVLRSNRNYINFRLWDSTKKTSKLYLSSLRGNNTSHLPKDKPKWEISTVWELWQKKPTQPQLSPTTYSPDPPTKSSPFANPTPSSAPSWWSSSKNRDSNSIHPQQLRTPPTPRTATRLSNRKPPPPAPFSGKNSRKSLPIWPRARARRCDIYNIDANSP